VHVALDPSTWNTFRSPFSGSAVGQTFLAADTLIKSITVWRPPGNYSVWSAHLYVTRTDANGRPTVGQTLLDGPTLTVLDSDPPGQLIPMPFVLDPPLTLPGPGVYAFFLHVCTPGSVWNIVANDTDPIQTASTG
jgi:hypothetical protein